VKLDMFVLLVLMQHLDGVKGAGETGEIWEEEKNSVSVNPLLGTLRKEESEKRKKVTRRKLFFFFPSCLSLLAFTSLSLSLVLAKSPVDFQ